MRRTRFQHGSLQLAERKRGQQAWEYRWYETLADGRRRRRSLVVGNLERYPNETAAKRAVASLLVTSTLRVRDVDLNRLQSKP